MIIHKDITDTVGQLAFCRSGFNSLKEQIGNSENIDPQTYQNNIRELKDKIDFHFGQYLGSRKTYNHEIIENEDLIKNLEKDFMGIFHLLGDPTIEQIIQLKGIIYKIQKLIVDIIQHNHTYYLHLQKNFPDNFS